MQGTECQIIETSRIFKDYQNCAVYGYSFSQSLIQNFPSEFTNKYKPYTQFVCAERVFT